MHSAKTGGFTLVELSIVMIIIGLLIGGVLKGQKLIENSKINATISQVTAYQAAIHTFKNSYGNIPGDIPSASVLVPNCNASTFCTNGNGNLVIGTRINFWEDPSGDNENTQFWKHLALADLIGGIQPGANPATPDWGTTYPANKFTGGFQVIASNNVTDDYGGQFMKLRQNVTGNDCLATDTCPVNPRIASIIDTRMDDGRPGTGNIVSHDAGAGAVSGCEGTLPYNTASESGNCILMFRMELK